MSSRHRLSTHLRRLSAALVAAVTGVALAPALAGPAQADRVTPGNFTGFGFDQCVAPESWKMDRWMEYSPFMAVGIYISGDSRACRNQPNLSKAWVEHQVKNRWRLLPITLGPQPYCNPRFPRYGGQDMKTSSSNRWQAARTQGNTEGQRAAAAAARLGLTKGSTLWYDLEAYDHRNNTCRLSAMAFLHGWSNGVRGKGYISGVYSSAGSGMKAIFDEKTNPSSYKWRLPDRVWIADWDGKQNVHSQFLNRTFWFPHNRLKQYRGGHNETWGGVTINIDSNWLVLGKGNAPAPKPKLCGGVNIDFAKYINIKRNQKHAQVKALQCLLKRQGRYAGPIDGVYDGPVIKRGNEFLKTVGRPQNDSFSWGDWTAILSAGSKVTMKQFSHDASVRRIQRTMNAAVRSNLKITGHFDAATKKAVRTYQKQTGMNPTGHVVPTIWAKLNRGVR